MYACCADFSNLRSGKFICDLKSVAWNTAGTKLAGCVKFSESILIWDTSTWDAIEDDFLNGKGHRNMYFLFLRNISCNVMMCELNFSQLQGHLCGME